MMKKASDLQVELNEAKKYNLSTLTAKELTQLTNTLGLDNEVFMDGDEIIITTDVSSGNLIINIKKDIIYAERT